LALWSDGYAPTQKHMKFTAAVYGESPYVVAAAATHAVRFRRHPCVGRPSLHPYTDMRATARRNTSCGISTLGRETTAAHVSCCSAARQPATVAGSQTARVTCLRQVFVHSVFTVATIVYLQAPALAGQMVLRSPPRPESVPFGMSANVTPSRYSA